jgi:hypothetical protein
MAVGSIIACPVCQKKFKAKKDVHGKRIRCPFCKVEFVVPTAEEAARARAAAKSSAAPDEDESDESNPYGVTHEETESRCPNCANVMESKEAVVCLFCGYNTLTRTWGKTETVLPTTVGDYMRHLLPGILCVVFVVLQTAFVIFYCLVLPNMDKVEWLSALSDHESSRMWITVVALLDSWPAGYFAFSRLIINPRPPERVLK